MNASAFGRDRQVQGFIACAAFSRAGDAAWTVALIWTAVHLASPATAGAVLAAGTIPRALVLLYGGVVADRVDSLRLLRITNLACATVLGVLAVVAWTSGLTVPVLVLGAVLFGIADALANPALSTVPRQLVAPEELAEYSGVSLGVQRTGAMIGAALGGILVATWDAGVGAAVDAVSFLAMAGLLAVVRPRYPLSRSTGGSAWQGIVAGFRHLAESPATRTVVLSLMGLNLAVDPALDLGIGLRASHQDWGAHAVGFSEALFGVGAILGSLVMVRIKPRRIGLWGFGPMVAQGLAIMALGYGGRAFLFGVCVLIGLLVGASSVSLNALFQTVVDQAYLGRMSAIQSLGDDVFMPVANVGFGGLAGVSMATPFVVFGAAMAAVMSLALGRPAIRGARMPDADPQDEAGEEQPAPTG
ncbi:MAG: MFS transporter [Nocardioides sp.]|uniref:MFS transporter n=1 Tax=Nocardioides sp. TaxID=35761 RepID=UPI0039E3E08E